MSSPRAKPSGSNRSRKGGYLPVCFCASMPKNRTFGLSLGLLEQNVRFEARHCDKVPEKPHEQSGTGENSAFAMTVVPPCSLHYSLHVIRHP